MIRIAGQVQGVGFRPFVYNLALDFGLKGYVSNDEQGVIIRAEGLDRDIQDFYRKLIQDPPPLSRLGAHLMEDAAPVDFEAFQIRASEKGGLLNLQLTPDFGICDSCRKEIVDPENRRFGYPFTTCVNCGPRWALTRNFPFEREHTSLAEFDMCSGCSAEYSNPSDRRFHSQTNSCGDCGIPVRLCLGNGEEVVVPESELFKKMAGLISEGKILAIKNTGGYLLCCDADNADVIERLRKRKRRPAKPFALLYPSLDILETDLDVNPQQREALLSVQRPIVILPFRQKPSRLAIQAIAPGLNQLGIMLPYSGLLELLAKELPRPIVATSGNLHGSPILSDENESLSALEGVADYFVHHDLPIENPQDDSVIKLCEGFGQRIMFRRSRGFAPNFFDFRSARGESIMAMGSQLKSTLAYLPNSYLYQSQYLGNLDNYEVFERFQHTVDKFIRIFEQPPECILVDAHPEYLSTRTGKEMADRNGIRCIEVQHHRAHFASVLGEHGLFESEEPVLGVIWDGTGYGDDQQIWGGEFFLYRNQAMERWNHLDYFDWIAGDRMALEPRLSLLSLSDESMYPALVEKFNGEEMRIYSKLLSNNRLKTSSVGRLFDAAASLLDLCDHNTYEGEAAILLENHIEAYDLKTCKSLLDIEENNVISPHRLILNMHREKNRGIATEKLAADFLFTLAAIVKHQVRESGVKKVAFSGGVFQNSILVDLVREMLKGEFDLYFSSNLAPNDENIAHGQMMYYLNQLRQDQ